MYLTSFVGTDMVFKDDRYLVVRDVTKPHHIAYPFDRRIVTRTNNTSKTLHCKSTGSCRTRSTGLRYSSGIEDFTNLQISPTCRFHPVSLLSDCINLQISPTIGFYPVFTIITHTHIHTHTHTFVMRRPWSYIYLYDMYV